MTIPRIALVSMPFASTRRPSIQIGILKGLAEKVGWHADTFHFNLDFAALIGRKSYEVLCQHRGIQLSDWIFSPAAFGQATPDPEGKMLSTLPGEYRKVLADVCPTDDLDQWLVRIRNIIVPPYIETARKVLQEGTYDIVGFSSTFQQNTASFALAVALKNKKSDSIMLFGGANFDDEMGLEFVRAIPVIDYAAIGEADNSFPEFLDRVARSDNPGDTPGIASRNAENSVCYVPQPVPFNQMDSLPIPDYDEFFTRFERLGFQGQDPRRKIDLPVEGSRGCWWGARSQCIFCGLNAGTIQYRAKSPRRFMREINALSLRYRNFHIELVDNIIDMELFDKILPSLARQNNGWNFFFEVKSNLKPEQVQLLALAGVRRIQPGIESLSTPVLRLMKKGVTAIQNVNLLRWCAVYGIRPSWNLLWGIPGESIQLYEEQAKLIPHLVHLEPPDGEGRIWMERFSPLYTQRETLDVAKIEPAKSYQYVYPDSIDLNRAAYFFDYELSHHFPDGDYLDIVEELTVWRNAARSDQPPSLRAFCSPEFVRIDDSRGAQYNGMYELENELAKIYNAFMDVPAKMSTKAENLGISISETESIVDDFCHHGLMLREGNLALSLALPTVAP